MAQIESDKEKPETCVKNLNKMSDIQTCTLSLAIISRSDHYDFAMIQKFHDHSYSYVPQKILNFPI